MKILIDIGHPAHVHLFRHFAVKMIEKGHDILFTCRDKEFEVYLLNLYGFKYVSFGKKFNNSIGKIWGMFKFDLKEVLTAIRFNPDIFLSHGSIYASHASKIYNKPHISLEDTFNIEQMRLYLPFTNVLLTGDYQHPYSMHTKVVNYSGYHELAYLHPAYFKPDETVLNEMGVEKREKYIIFRFVSWNATHDKGHKGIAYQTKLMAIEKFLPFAKIFISAESDLPADLEKYRIKIPAHRIHDAMAFATFLWGESFTMPAECAVLGTPSIINHDTRSLYLHEQEKKYELCYCFTESENDQIKAIEKGMELLKTDGLKEKWTVKRQKMLSDKIDVTGFLVWFVENYPDSLGIMKNNPEFQLKFK